MAKKLECDYETARTRLLEATRVFRRSLILIEMFKPEAYSFETICVAASYACLYKCLLLDSRLEITENFEKPSFSEVKESIDKEINNLTEREKKVLVNRFGLDDGRAKYLKEVALMYDVNSERIRKIEAKALRKLKRVEYKKACTPPKWILEEADFEFLDDDSTIDLLELSVRTYNCLRRAGIETLGDLTSMTLEELKKVEKLSSKGLDEILKMLEIGNLKLKEE